MPETITIEKPRPFAGLNEQGASDYFRALLGGAALLQNEVIKPFEAALKENSGFDNRNIPSRETVTTETIDRIVFSVTTKPTNKRPGYAEVFEALQAYLRFCHEEFDEGARKPGIITIDSNAYISVDLVVDKVNAWQNEVKDSIVEQSISFNGVEAPEKLVVPIRYYGELKAGNGEVYARAKKLLEKIKDSSVSPFEAALKGSTGYNKDNIPSETQAGYKQIGNSLFRILSVPKSSTSYGKVVNSLVKENKSGRITKTTGELILVREGIQNGGTAAYDVRIRDGRPFVSIQSLADRAEEIVEENTSPSLTQTISCYLIR